MKFTTLGDSWDIEIREREESEISSGKITLRFLKKLKIELPYDPAISLLGIYLDRAIIQKGACTPICS